MPTKILNTETRVKVHDENQAMEAVRSGGEKRPFEYPHLYQIQAGDWRISYAVEHNRLAILVLEVLTPEGTVRKDPASQKLARKMKVKLLDWPEGEASHDIQPEELGKKLKIKLLDLVDDEGEGGAQPAHGKLRVKLKGTSESARKGTGGKITFLDTSEVPASEEVVDAETLSDGTEAAGKVTPLDSPTL